MFNSSAVAIGAATAAVLGAATWGVVAGSAESEATADHSADRGVQTLTVHWKAVGFRAVDLGPKGDSPGDFFLYQQKWYNKAKTRVTGKALARCEIGLPPTKMTCEVTGRLEDRGKIRFGGTSFGDHDRVNVVTGGTGDFLGVGGVVHVRAVKGLFIFKFVR